MVFNTRSYLHILHGIAKSNTQNAFYESTTVLLSFEYSKYVVHGKIRDFFCSLQGTSSIEIMLTCHIFIH